MKVKQALILAGGTGSRLGLGTKSYLMYKGKIILEYAIKSCVNANIENIVVALVPKKLEKNIEKRKLKRLSLLIKQYPNIKFIRGQGLSFGETPDEVRQYLNENEPFFIMCGQSPQSSSHLKRMAKKYKSNSIVTSGYKYRYDYVVSIGKVSKDQIVSFVNIESARPKVFVANTKELITHHPYIIKYDFYDKYLKGDNYKDKFELCPNKFLKDGGDVFFLKNPIKISEVDYKVDLPKLHKSIDYLIENNYK